MTDNATIRFSDQEMKELAMDVYTGKVFTDRQIRGRLDNPDMPDWKDVVSVFMPLLFMEEQAYCEWLEKEPALLYEYMSAAGPRGFNGMPCFMSVRYLTKSELDLFNSKYQEVLDFMGVPDIEENAHMVIVPDTCECCNKTFSNQANSKGHVCPECRTGLTGLSDDDYENDPYI